MSSLARANGRRLPSLPEETAWSGDFTFVQAADTQFGLISRYVDKVEPGTDPVYFAKEIHLARRLVRELNALQPVPRFLIICGDMLDAFPNDELAEIRRAQFAAFVDCFKQLRPDVPLVCVCGNHDVGDRPTSRTVSIYRETWGDDYYEFWVGGCQMLVVNSQFYVNSSEVPDERSAMHAWLRERLRAGSPVHRFVFMHVPPFLQDAATDPDCYFNLPLDERLILLNLLDDCRVTAVLCGHAHRNVEAKFNNRLPVVVTSAVGAQIGKDKHGYRLVTVAREGFGHRYVEFDCPVNLPGDVGCDVCPKE